MNIMESCFIYVAEFEEPDHDDESVGRTGERY